MSLRRAPIPKEIDEVTLFLRSHSEWSWIEAKHVDASLVLRVRIDHRQARELVDRLVEATDVPCRFVSIVTADAGTDFEEEDATGEWSQDDDDEQPSWL